MDDQITPEEALELVAFRRNCDGDWFVRHVHGDVYGDVYGSVHCNVHGNVNTVLGDVDGDIDGDVGGTVHGRINGLKWQFVETPKEKLQRLIEAKGDQELLEAFNQLEDN